MKSSSWQRISDTVVIKRIDKSFIVHEGTSVPNEFLEFFSSSTLKKGEKRDLVLKYKDILVNAYVQLDNNENPHARMFWRSSNLSESIQINYPEYNWASVNSENYDKDNLPFVSYQKIDGNMISINIISSKHNKDYGNYKQILKDLESIKEENEYFEGNKKSRITSYYERNPQLRVAAVNIHGTKCKICGFDFEKTYGERGAGYIEVHHLVLVSSLDTQTKVDPEKDMTVVCSNCHRMIHRSKDDILTPDRLTKLIDKTH